VNEPYFESFVAFDQYLYSDFAHSHSLLGSEDNIRNLTLEDVKSFYSTFYVPNNAVLCITGNFNALRTRELVARYFENIPPGKDVPQSFAPLVYTKKPIVASFVDRFAAAPAFHMGFRMASPISNDHYTLTIIDYILFRARSSRLIRRLLNPDNKIAYQVSGGIEQRKDRVTYKIFCVVNTPGMGDQCQNAIFSELDKLKKIFISDDDLARYKTVFRQDYLGRLSTSMDKAIYLCESYLSLGNFDDLPLELEKFMKVSPNDIIPFVNRYFTVDNSVILNVKTR
jgi:predicted Zn-dependent peptidase